MCSNWRLRSRLSFSNGIVRKVTTLTAQDELTDDQACIKIGTPQGDGQAVIAPAGPRLWQRSHAVKDDERERRTLMRESVMQTAAYSLHWGGTHVRCRRGPCRGRWR